MTLTFTQSSDQSFGGVPAYEAEFEVTGNFAIHIERTRGDAALILKQRTGGGKYALVDDFNYAKSKGEVLDYEASVSIPKFIKIVSEVEPTLAEIVTDGEVTEIKAQAKEIEVTTNGTTEVIPDSGFAYLSKVNIKTNVPQSGEGGGSTGGVVYLDLTTVPGAQDLAVVASLVKVKQDDGSYIIAPPMQSITTNGSIDMDKLLAAVAMAVNPNDKVVSSYGEMTINESFGGYLSQLPEITEEEFYNLNA